MDIADLLRTERRSNGMTAKELASLAGVSTSTVTRIESYQLRPTFDVAQRLLTIFGLSIDTQRGADPAVVAAARSCLDPTTGIEVTQARTDWLRRWQRAGYVDDDWQATDRRGVMRQAAVAARTYRRSGLVDLAPDVAWWDVADALDDTDGLDWAATGSIAANLVAPMGGDERPTFYVSDLAVAVEALGLRSLPPSEYGDRITLLPFDGVVELGRTVDASGLPVAATDQVLLDCFGGTGRMPELAEAVLDVLSGVTV